MTSVPTASLGSIAAGKVNRSLSRMITLDDLKGCVHLVVCDRYGAEYMRILVPDCMGVKFIDIFKR